ncbi:MAG: hypothetical protein EA401_10960 [Planctomycetota bacterium]|nr:MAG: hypothetical protein EA401_10960 [Planctomycetota bacterium]
MKTFIMAVALLLPLSSCDLRTSETQAHGPYVGKHRTEPDVEVQFAQLVYRDDFTGQWVPILAGQAPVVGTTVAVNVGLRVVSGSDVRDVEYRIVDEFGNVVLPKQRHTFQRNRDLGLNRRNRSTLPMEIVVLKHQAITPKRLFVQVTGVDGFPDWNPANDSRELTYSPAVIDSSPQVVSPR